MRRARVHHAARRCGGVHACWPLVALAQQGGKLPQDREGPRPHGAADHSNDRRRGDRVMGWMAPLRHLRAKLLSDRESAANEEPSMGEVTTIGLDLAKHVFQVHGVDADGATVLRNDPGDVAVVRHGTTAPFIQSGAVLLELSRPECGTVVGINIPPDVRFAGDALQK
jgi:hypothetical protein